MTPARRVGLTVAAVALAAGIVAAIGAGSFTPLFWAGVAAYFFGNQ